MKKILVFGASNSSISINRKLAISTSELINAEANILDLNDFEMPIYSYDREKASGIPELAHQFKNHIDEADGIVISFAEHNGAYSAAYKNIYDWVSRIDSNVWQNKPMILLATSPGGRGGKGVLEIAYNSYSFGNKNVIGKLPVPKFHENFDPDIGITDPKIKVELLDLIKQFETLI